MYFIFKWCFIFVFKKFSWNYSQKFMRYHLKALDFLTHKFNAMFWYVKVKTENFEISNCFIIFIFWVFTQLLLRLMGVVWFRLCLIAYIPVFILIIS